jgi:hypothetical protein
VASLRIRQPKDGSTYTSVLYVLDGKQSSSSFDDRAEAVRFQELANKTSPAKAPEVRTSRGATTRDYTVAGYTGSRLSAGALGSSGQPTDPVPVDPNHHFLPKLGIYAPQVGEFFRCRASFAEVILVEAITNLSEKHLVSRVGSRVGD